MDADDEVVEWLAAVAVEVALGLFKSNGVAGGVAWVEATEESCTPCCVLRASMRSWFCTRK